MRALTLDDIVPKKVSFKLSSVSEKEFEIRPLNQLDKQWLKQTFSTDEMSRIFRENDFDQIGRIVFHQFSNETKQFFAKQKVTIMNEEGETNEIEIGGVKLFFSLIEGLKEQVEIIRCLTEAFGISKALQDSIANDDDAEKKSDQPIGLAFSTPSQANMDGALTTSSL